MNAALLVVMATADEERVMSKGEQGYIAYGNAGNWQTFDGRDMPSWEQLSDSPGGRETQRRWEVAAEAILQVHTVPLI